MMWECQTNAMDSVVLELLTVLDCMCWSGRLTSMVNSQAAQIEQRKVQCEVCGPNRQSRFWVAGGCARCCRCYWTSYNVGFQVQSYGCDKVLFINALLIQGSFEDLRLRPRLRNRLPGVSLSSYVSAGRKERVARSKNAKAAVTFKFASRANAPACCHNGQLSSAFSPPLKPLHISHIS